MLGTVENLKELENSMKSFKDKREIIYFGQDKIPSKILRLMQSSIYVKRFS